MEALKMRFVRGSLSFGSLILTLFIGAVFLELVGANPVMAYGRILKGAFGSLNAVSELLLKVTPILLIALSYSISHRLLWNVGGEGQLVVGAIATTLIALFFAGSLPPVLLPPALIISGFLGGAFWGAIPGLLKIWGINEIVITLMMNYLAIQAAEYLYQRPWKDPQGGFPRTPAFPLAARLPIIAGRLHLGILLAVVSAVVICFFLKYTLWGYYLRVLDDNPEAARFAGVNRGKAIVVAMIISGGLAGLAGMGEVTVARRLQPGIAAGYGYTAILAAWLGGLNPLGIMISSLVMAIMAVGGDQLQIGLGLSAQIGDVLQATLFLCFILAHLLRSNRIRQKEGEK